MATNRSRRLRKKLCVDEFQELGFELNLDWMPMAWTMLVVTTSGWFAWLGVALSVKNSAQLWRAGSRAVAN